MMHTVIQVNGINTGSKLKP